MLKDQIKRSLSSGYQIKTSMIPEAALPVFVILACYSRYHEDIELVDNYDNLLDAFREATRTFGNCAHPDLFLASCIVILDPREQYPTREGFDSVGVPDIFRELVNLEE